MVCGMMAIKSDSCNWALGDHEMENSILWLGVKVKGDVTEQKTLTKKFIFSLAQLIRPKIKKNNAKKKS